MSAQQAFERFRPESAWQAYFPNGSNPWNAEKVAHLYRRAAFGASWDEIQAGVADSPARLVSRLLAGGKDQAKFSEEAKRLTDKSLYRQVSNLMLETDEQLNGDGIEVNAIVKATPLSVEADQALVRVEWKERKYKRGGNAGAWAGFYGTLSVARVEPADTGEIQSNPLGLYITSFTFAASGIDLSQVRR